jgi:glycosyltransferase involved in cell wall biosynthesis
VSVVLPTLNVREHVTDCLDSLERQDHDGDLDIIVVDRGSSDGTPELARRRAPRVCVLDRPQTSSAAAMNAGIGVARGAVICRADAPLRYERDYVRRALAVLCETGAAGVGGSMRPVGTTSFGRAVAAMTTSRYGIGARGLHDAPQHDVDSVHLGCWERAAIDAVGGYDERELPWAEGDEQLSLRLRAAGRRIVLDPTLRGWYFPRANARSLARQYYNGGLAKAAALRDQVGPRSWLPLAPAALVAGTVALAIGRRRVACAAVPALHAAACAAAAWTIATDPGAAPPRAFAAIEVCHWSYGAGLLAGMLGRPAQAG